MDLKLSEEQELLRRVARNFLAAECSKEHVRDMEEDEKGYSPSMWQKMAEMGWLGLGLPEEYDGTGSFLDLAILLEELGRGCLPGPFFSTTVLGSLTLLDAANESQKREILPNVAAGNTILTLALTESNASWTADGVNVKAVDVGDYYAVSGTKLFVPDANVADWLILVCRTSAGKIPADGITLLLVDPKSTGITCDLLKTMAGDKQCALSFENVNVPAVNVIGKVGQGWPVVERALQRAAVAKCIEMVGGAQRVLEMTVAYAKERVQFDRPIGSFQAVQHHCANMATDVDGARLIAYKAAWLLSEGLPCTMEAAMAKAWLSEAYLRVTSLGHQVHGGIGFTKEHDMELYFRRARVAGLAYGAAPDHLDSVATALGF